VAPRAGLLHDNSCRATIKGMDSVFGWVVGSSTAVLVWLLLVWTEHRIGDWQERKDAGSDKLAPRVIRGRQEPVRDHMPVIAVPKQVHAHRIATHTTRLVLVRGIAALLPLVHRCLHLLNPDRSDAALSRISGQPCPARSPRIGKS
jgi:hypothetical protein